MLTRHLHPRHLAAALLALGTALPAAGFNVFALDDPPTQGLKWGSNAYGTPGGTVTWSLMADGTGLSASAASLGFSGNSSLSTLFSQVGGQAAALAMMQSAFDAWAGVADIHFQQVVESGSTDFGAPYGGPGVVGHLRIGAFAISGFSGAVGYAPPPNGGTTLEGDVVFNLNARIGVAPGNDGDPFALYPFDPGSNDPKNGWYLNDFEGLFTHELGHALGLAHSSLATALMCGAVPGGPDGSQCEWADPDLNGFAPITRVPRADDIAGIQFIYGPSPVPEPATLLLWLAGLVGLAAARRWHSGH